MSFEQRLALRDYLRHQFGVTDVHSTDSVRQYYREFNDNTRGAMLDSDGHTKVYKTLTLKVDDAIGAERLRRYDRNILNHLEQMNKRREPSIQLKYFQLLAGFYTEYYLDQFTTNRVGLLKDLNQFVHTHNQQHKGGITYPAFELQDLNKLAFWMATGSGKTLIMHLNYYQFMHYMPYMDEPPQNMLLITPNAGLTRQHRKELSLSSIPNQYYQEATEDYFGTNADSVQVIEITKLVEDKTGEGESIEISAFENNNLIFVDEGHKGIASGVWKGYRDALSRHGFAFEYSATFGQALNKSSTPAAVQDEYGKVILFDYSYPRFYDDGYGKDYRILNLKENQSFSDDTRRHTYLLANLLTFYEQLWIYHQQPDRFYKEWNIARPLLVFIGHSVQSGQTRSGLRKDEELTISDVQTLVLFLKEFLSNDGGWVPETLSGLLAGRSGISREDGTDLFEQSFDILKTVYRNDASKLYSEILHTVFHVKGPADLHLFNLKSAEGEIALRAGDQEHYFGVINIGEDRLFLDFVEENFPEISVGDDTFQDSLFNSINSQQSQVNILIGSKKFIEGWDSYRVSNMGLMNIGKSEGPQIIQLFGRGVRLLGKNRSLKRSSTLENISIPQHIQSLETLQIFGLQANYMEQFQKYLKAEGIDTEERSQLHLDITIQDHFRNQGLMVPKPKKWDDFSDVVPLILEVDKAYAPKVDLAVRVEEELSGDQISETPQPEYSAASGTIGTKYLPLLDANRIFQETWHYRQQKQYTNLSFTTALLMEILYGGHYTLIVDDQDIVRPKRFQDIRRLEEIAIMVLRKYVDQFYRQKQRAWEYQQLEYQPVSESDPNIPRIDGGNPGYQLDVKTTVLEKIESELQKILQQRETLEKDVIPSSKHIGEIPRIFFDRHLYLPLLLHDQKEIIKSIPPGLNEGEWRFVQDLRAAITRENGQKILSGCELFLLRNQSRGHGIGFLLEDERYFPDFILWIKTDKKQHICFIDPKGLQHEINVNKNKKVQFARSIKEYEQKLAEKSQRNDIALHSFIISQTGFSIVERNNEYSGYHPYNDLNIYFPTWLEEGGQDGYIAAMLGKVLI